MAQELVIYKKCPQCNGTGTHQSSHGPGAGGPITCNWPGCENGYIASDKITFDPCHDDIMDKCNDILDKCNDILEQVSE